MARDETPETADASSPDPSEGPVHYQISITGKQAGWFFFALLVSLGLAFFFGMKTGAAARRGYDPSARAGGSDGAAFSSLPSDEKTDKVEKTEKADKGEPSGSSPTKSAPPAVAEVGEKKLGFDDGPSATPRPTETPRAESTPALVAVQPTATPAPIPTHHARPEPTVGTPTGATTVEKSPKPTKSPAPGPFFVQLLATHNTKMADELVKKLKKQGFKADVSSAPKQPDLFRVRVGPYGDHAKAEAGKAKIKKLNPTLKNPVVAP